MVIFCWENGIYGPLSNSQRHIPTNFETPLVCNYMENGNKVSQYTVDYDMLTIVFIY